MILLDKEGSEIGRADPPKEIVIGQWADYYAEHDGMIEKGPGCSERLQTRIDALPDGHPSKIQLYIKDPNEFGSSSTNIEVTA